MTITPSDRAAGAPSRPVRAARRTLPPGSAGKPGSAPPVAEPGTPSSPRRERAAAGKGSPGTGAGSPCGETAPARGPTTTPAPDTRAAHLDRALASGRVPGKTPTGSALASREREAANGVLSAGQQAIAAAMSEDRGPDSLDAHVRRMFKDLGLKAYHTRTSVGSAKGYPDWTICGDRVIFRELKTQRGKVTPDQEAWLDALTLAGQDADVWRPECLLSGRIARELAALAGLRAGAA